MTTIFQWCKGVVYYLDDILVTGSAQEEHTYPEYKECHAETAKISKAE